jgi:hypothetical protein
MSAMWHAARGLALAATGKAADAQKELAEVAKRKDDPSLKTLPVSSVNMTSAIVAIAHEVLAAEIATAEKRAPTAAQHFAAAGEARRRTDLHGTARLAGAGAPVARCGAASARRAKEAEAAFRADMKKFPDNGWSLSGLAASLEQQGRAADAAGGTSALHRDVEGGRRVDCWGPRDERRRLEVKGVNGRRRPSRPARP